MGGGLKVLAALEGCVLHAQGSSSGSSSTQGAGARAPGNSGGRRACGLHADARVHAGRVQRGKPSPLTSRRDHGPAKDRMGGDRGSDGGRERGCLWGARRARQLPRPTVVVSPTLSLQQHPPQPLTNITSCGRARDPSTSRDSSGGGSGRGRTSRLPGSAGGGGGVFVCSMFSPEAQCSCAPPPPPRDAKSAPPPPLPRAPPPPPPPHPFPPPPYPTHPHTASHRGGGRRV